MDAPPDKVFAPGTVPLPGVFTSYGHAWRQMRKYFIELLLVSVVALLVSLPSIGLSVDEFGEFIGERFSLDLFIVRLQGPWGYVIFALAYILLFEWPIEYGAAFTFLLAARNEKFEVKRMFEVFKNWGNAVMANILQTVIVGVGVVFLIVPGIIFGCKLAFVPYLIVDRRMDAVAAIKESWRMTRGHAWKVFAVGCLALFVALLGLVLFGVGILVSIMWIRLASATLYWSIAGPMHGGEPSAERA